MRVSLLDGERASEKLWSGFVPIALRVNLTPLLEWDLTGWVILLSRLLTYLISILKIGVSKRVSEAKLTHALIIFQAI
jgi:hypothetical protein